MSNHLYGGLAGKVRWFVRRFGAAELLLVPARAAMSAAVIPFLARRTFHAAGVEHSYFYHRYNATWANERCVEVPLARAFLAQAPGAAALEIGHVLGHYAPVTHTVLDKYERATGVVNADILEYQPGRTFDRIASISTFEHIGFDDETAGDSGEKILAAIAATRALLAPGGVFWLSAPLGYNPELDALIGRDALGARRMSFMQRTQRRLWEEAPWSAVCGARYMHPYPFANALLIAEFDAAR